ncbi:AraC family transcriptional regulator [Nonomuraea aridisoli]|uniref:AraC family transcriptional regulator n=1 Tax=Nonomuraea aridisoli TaxID=2070368 RepID=A0A2W2EUQ4_9ACTN|nr:AraC family transcriptional regulator [Nonomuraea aridisoli]PZG13117.1 AraC family transcriptional regulator [Nonomuraea aridisoli]
MAQILRRAWDHALSLDDEKKEMEQFFNSFDIDALGGGRPSARMRYARCGPVVIGDITHDADVLVRPADSRSGYHVLVPLNGRVESRYLGGDIVLPRGTALLYRAEGAVSTRLGGGARVLNARFDLTHVHRMLESQVGEPVNEQILFSPVFDAGRGTSWTRLLLTIVDQLGLDDSVMLNPLVALPYAESLLQGLLLAADHPHRRLLDRRAEPARPGAVRIAIDLMEAGPDRPFTTSMLAAEAHVSVRTLQEGFRRHLGTSPMAYLRGVRLRRAHESLLAADPSRTTVASIARRWGFTHLGRFAAAYQAAYGRPPATTLRAPR